MAKWRTSSFREHSGERAMMKAQIFYLSKQLGALHVSQMTAAVLTWKQPVVRQRDADIANLRGRLAVHIGANDEALRRIENQNDAQHVDTRHRLRAVETAFATHWVLLHGSRCP